jgi:glyoxylase-like metal-dependent hydrolase (beta-lactamase superfamily II)
VKASYTALAVLALSTVSSAQQPSRPAADVRSWHVQGQVWLINAGAVNAAAQIGDDGVLVVDTGTEALGEKILTEIKRLAPDKPIRYIINTSADADHAGGNASIVAASSARGGQGAPFAFVGLDRPEIFAHEAVLNRLTSATGDAAVPANGLPTAEYFQPQMDFYTNGEPVILYHQPAAHSDGDTIVLFRRSDVISTGDVFTPGRYPAIDVAHGGSVDGLIVALTQVLTLAVPEAFESGGTQIVPGHGRVSEETDVAEFRDMVVIVRDRIRDSMNKRRTLDQIKAEKPSRDYDREYHATPADTERFVESIYRSIESKVGGKS